MSIRICMYSLCLDGMACSFFCPDSGFGDDDVNGLRETAPIGGFFFELVSAGLGQRVKLGLAAGLAFGPVGGDPTLLFEAVQSGVE